ncbi:phosphoribosyltransferase-like protein [Chryseobacterium sp. RRHN12]|uniref:phosphoribosyltransferase-like protein n=1 Tax=Chryseobacterium TaxID=59732 RepID=UPI0025774940|nr:hypothetical protein [Chryseobacterium indologenes]MDM1556105.1 hypothetical protein [Chryseobacterium indologenes]
MKTLVESIYEIIKDYRVHDGIEITPEKILKWSEQFGDDAELILTELNNILPFVYISRDTAKEYILSHIKVYLKLFGFDSVSKFLMDTEFLNVQHSYKSQPAILKLLEEVLEEKYSLSYMDYSTFPKTHYIYFDDILASGSTIGRDVINFLNEEDDQQKKNHEKLAANEITLSVSVFCLHSWGRAFQEYRITKTFSDKVSRKINWYLNYEIENHAKYSDQKLNVAKPVKGNNTKINSYLENLSADKHEDYAYRRMNTPVNETFFTNSENRIKYENIITEKGIDIIDMIAGEVKPNLRPLGLINPAYKIFGLGTHFFTWRNIPNNCPLVYWWQVPGHDWIPLFPVANRG